MRQICRTHNSLQASGDESGYQRAAPIPDFFDQLVRATTAGSQTRSANQWFETQMSVTVTVRGGTDGTVWTSPAFVRMDTVGLE